METERKEAAREDVGQIPPTAAVSLAGEAQVKEKAEISAATAETGQLLQEQWGVGHHWTPLALTWLDALCCCV